MIEILRKQLSKRSSRIGSRSVNHWLTFIAFSLGLSVTQMHEWWQLIAIVVLAFVATNVCAAFEAARNMPRCSKCDLIVPYATHVIELEGKPERLCNACGITFLKYVAENFKELSPNNLQDEDAE